jgi:DNA-binding CsgD family transcriptional regulator
VNPAAVATSSIRVAAMPFSAKTLAAASTTLSLTSARLTRGMVATVPGKAPVPTPVIDLQRVPAYGARYIRVSTFAFREVTGGVDPHMLSRDPAVEALSDPGDQLAALRSLHAGARVQVRSIEQCDPSRPPSTGPGLREMRAESRSARIAAGVRYRTIHPANTPDAIAPVPGELLRTLAAPPLGLLVADDDRALLHLDGTSMLVTDPTLLAALARTFEALWALAVPITVTTAVGQDLSDRDRRIVTLMAAGATDDAIARRLGLSRRTVVRRVAVLQGQLGATTRFQAGVQAAQRGWL